MAQLTTTTEKRSNLNNVINDLQQNENRLDWEDGSVKGIIKAITWPKLPKVLKVSFKSLLASTVIATILYFYGYAINQIIAFFA